MKVDPEVLHRWSIRSHTAMYSEVVPPLWAYSSIRSASTSSAAVWAVRKAPSAYWSSSALVKVR